VVRMGHRLWGGCRCPIRGTQRLASAYSGESADGREWRPALPNPSLHSHRRLSYSPVSHRHSPDIPPVVRAEAAPIPLAASARS